ncbi:ispD [Acrasis kona]|uniref:IspD n=1 Tax=Acrasis kona TaxID=1008807 RepID=A0AAW2YS21_9EUKA
MFRNVKQAPVAFVVSVVRNIIRRQHKSVYTIQQHNPLSFDAHNPRNTTMMHIQEGDKYFNSQIKERIYNLEGMQKFINTLTTPRYLKGLFEKLLIEQRSRKSLKDVESTYKTLITCLIEKDSGMWHIEEEYLGGLIDFMDWLTYRSGRQILADFYKVKEAEVKYIESSRKEDSYIGEKMTQIFSANLVIESGGKAVGVTTIYFICNFFYRLQSHRMLMIDVASKALLVDVDVQNLSPRINLFKF